MLADLLQRELPPGIDETSRTKAAMYRARHFVLDVAAANFCRVLAEQHKPLVDELAEFALPPHDTMAISAGWHDVETFTLWDQGAWRLFLKRNGPGEVTAVIPGWTTIDAEGHCQNAAVVEKMGDSLPRLDIHMDFVRAFFLLLARPTAYQATFGEARTSIAGGKRVRYMARSDIRLSLTDVAAFRRGFYDGSRGAPRRHEVRRHFMHVGGIRTCIHAWEPIEPTATGKKRWQCAHCERRRIERGPFERGDANKGFVMQRYTVTA